ncbi:hypothetical protein EVAR_84379_1 [Eumeta japonica]|uniref:Uncharacterized protein n=1 Tax=Eumeta variegata TaxID=151549 RepID=A0A4C1U4I9_EUMVA|nr:hypothetical protein EVAR_84379_1 [Eumeta japonica]
MARRTDEIRRGNAIQEPSEINKIYFMKVFIGSIPYTRYEFSAASAVKLLRYEHASPRPPTRDRRAGEILRHKSSTLCRVKVEAVKERTMTMRLVDKHKPEDSWGKVMTRVSPGRGRRAGSSTTTVGGFLGDGEFLPYQTPTALRFLCMRSVCDSHENLNKRLMITGACIYGTTEYAELICMFEAHEHATKQNQRGLSSERIPEEDSYSIYDNTTALHRNTTSEAIVELTFCACRFKEPAFAESWLAEKERSF